VVFDARQWRRQSRTARARIAAPGTVPLTDRAGRIVMGATIRTVGHKWQPVLALPYEVMGCHQVVLGASGSGKTNLMIRTWAGWHAAALQAHYARGAPRALLVVLDCKGGPDARLKADRIRRLLHAARVALWPDDASLSLWALPPGDLAVALFQLVQSGTGAAAFYADAMQSTVRLAVTAPLGPPASAREFLARLEPAGCTLPGPGTRPCWPGWPPTPATSSGLTAKPPGRARTATFAARGCISAPDADRSIW